MTGPFELQPPWERVRLGIATMLSGAAVGLLGGVFLLALRGGEKMRGIWIGRIDGWPAGWLLTMLAGSLVCMFAAWLAERFAPSAPMTASGESGDPPWSALPVDFVGTSLATGAGLALGPERPAIQIGQIIGRTVGRLVRLDRDDADLLVDATGGAGVAAMFNAPLGCTAYVVEAIRKRFDMRSTLTTLGAGAVAVIFVRLLIGSIPNFSVSAQPFAPLHHMPLYLLLGCIVALLGSVHVRMIAGIFGLLSRRFPWPPARAAVAGALVGLLMWFAPRVVGGGEPLTQSVLEGRFTLSILLTIFAVRFLLGPLSLSASTPGGYFTPVLTLGALIGMAYGFLVGGVFPDAAIPATSFALVGMGAALGTVTRAPFTGVLLTMETTGSFAVLLPMTLAMFGAGVVTGALRSPSIATALHTLRATGGAQSEKSHRDGG
jgi:CIC family chloride channel protein